jgi:hypothetical protein
MFVSVSLADLVKGWSTGEFFAITNTKKGFLSLIPNVENSPQPSKTVSSAFVTPTADQWPKMQ